MGFIDYSIAAFYLMIFTIFLYGLRTTIRDRSIRSYFITGVHVKILAAVSFTLIHYYYYGGGHSFYGDTALYYRSIQYLTELFFSEPYDTLRILFGPNTYEVNPDLFNYTTRIFNYTSDSEFFVIRTGVWASLFALNNYMIIAVIFGLFCFWGQWKIFLVFIDLYPTLKKEVAIITLFVPSVVFWGSGLIKDPLTLGALGFMFSGLFNLFMKRRNIFGSFIFLSIGFLILLEVKKYILISFLPAAIVWVFYSYASKIKNQILKVLFLPAMLSMGLFIGFSTLGNLTADDPIYSLDEFGERAKISSDYLYYVSQRQGGSGYYLGKLDGTIESTLSLAPAAIVVTLFRPFIWEVSNVTMFLSAVESLIFSLLTLYVLFKIGIFKTFFIIAKSPFVQFCLVFSLIFAFAVGITTFNFGSLVRYKIPLIPFYLVAMLVILNNSRIKRTLRI